MIINEEGTYNLVYTATDECGNETVVNRELVVEDPVHIYGVEWDGSSSPAWVRTDESALFTDPVPQMSDGNGGWTVGSSPFDNIMPWSGMEIVEDAEAGTLVSIPKFYYKWTRDGVSMKLQIADKPQEGFLTSPAHMDRGDGVGERDVVYVGRYHCVPTTFKSTSGIAPLKEQPRSYFRTNIHSLGIDIWQYDFAMYWTICMLYLVEFANWNSQLTIGYGCSENNTVQSNGLTDNMTYHTGTNVASRNAYGQIQYRHIEGLWSNVHDWCDGAYAYRGGSVYVIKNPSDFSDDSGGVSVGGLALNGCISGFNTPPNGFEYALIPNDTVQNVDYDNYVCDRLDKNTSHGTTIAVGGCYEQNQQFGLFRFDVTAGATSYAAPPTTGSRLMKLPS